MDFELNTFQLANNWIPQLVGQLSRIRTERSQEIDSIAEIFGDPLELAKYYIEPDCQQINPADFREDENIVREPIFSRIETFISGDPLRPSNQLFILSDAGMGKTSALVMLKLSHLTSFWPKNHNCELIKLGPDSLSQIREMKEKRRTVLLLDALDEDPAAWGRVDNRLHDLLHESKNFLRVIITCRTQFFNSKHDPFNRRGQVNVSGFVCSAVYASLFSDKQVIAYINKRFASEVSKPEWRTKATKILQKMRFLRMRPMLLTHLQDLIDSGESHWNEYSVYRALVDTWLLREQRKAESADPDFVKKLKTACRYAAYQMMRQNRTFFSKTETAVLNGVVNSSMAGRQIDLGGRSLLNKDSDGSFRFSHFSIQECLAFEYLLASEEKTDPERFRITDFMRTIGAAWLCQAPPHIRKTKSLSFLGSIRADFDTQDLSGANLSGLDLTGCSFRGTNLSEAKLSATILKDADFTRATLTSTDLTNSDLSYANLSGAYISKADIRMTNLNGTIFSDTRVDNSSFRNAVFTDTTVWPHIESLESLGAIFRDSKQLSNTFEDPHLG